MYVERAAGVTKELYHAVNSLIPQLGTQKTGLSWGELNALVLSDSSTLLIARYPEEKSGIAGMLTLTLYRVPTGARSIVEDLIVDEKFRRRGIGEALLRRAIEIAREAGANGVALTSNLQREAANQLYQAMGFQRRETNAYFYKLE